jgi:septal ring factor EnvC (AmiA/AmiB activator)
MTRRTIVLAAVLIAATCMLVVVGCAGTRAVTTASENPEMIRKEIREIDNDIRNTEEMYKASLTQLQMEESVALRREVNRLWVDLEHLKSQKAALEKRLAELEEEDQGD